MKKIRLLLVMGMVMFCFMGCDTPESKESKESKESAVTDKDKDEKDEIKDDENKENDVEKMDKVLCTTLESSFNAAVLHEAIAAEVSSVKGPGYLFVTVKDGKLVFDGDREMNNLEQEIKQTLEPLGFSLPQESGKEFYYLSWVVAENKEIKDVTVKTVSGEEKDSMVE